MSGHAWAGIGLRTAHDGGHGIASCFSLSLLIRRVRAETHFSMYTTYVNKYLSTYIFHNVCLSWIEKRKKNQWNFFELFDVKILSNVGISSSDTSSLLTPLPLT